MKQNGLLLALCALLLLLTALPGCSPGEAARPDVPLDSLLQSIRDAYGGDYLPNMEIPEELLETQYGLTPDLYEEARGETPMISAHPDVVLVVRAAPGKAEDVERALTGVRDRKIADENQYPMNIAKTGAAQVVRNGDYVALLLVGAIYEGHGDEQEQAQFAKAEVQKAVDAFQGAFRS